MATKGLPPGAILTTINGRRCTGIPKSSTTTTNHGTTTTTSSTSTTTSTSSTTSTTSASSTTSTTLTTSTTSTTSPTTALVAAPAADADESTALADQSSTSTLSSSLVITTTAAITPGPAQVTPAQDSEAGPAPLAATSLPAAPPTPSDATLQSFTVLADITPSQVPVSAAQSSQTDGSVTAPAADTLATSAAADTADTTAPPLLPEGPAASPLLSTIESPQTTSNAVAAEATGTTSTNPASVNAVPAVNSNAVQSTVAVAGGVIGGVVAISVLAFFIWWWRRRMVKKRRSTLLTPLDAVPGADQNEKGGYVISRGSIGPTPVAEKVKAALGQNFKKIRSHIRNKTAPSVNLDRGPSQFMDTPSTRSRANSSVFDPQPTAKGRLLNWWSGLAGALKLNRRNQDVREYDSRATTQRRTSSQPDFLTLLNMDDRELDRETQRQRASLGRLKGSASSTDNFLGGLNLNFGASLDDNPFSDANAIAHTSAKPAPLAVGNPFSDANAIRDPSGAAPAPPKPATYVANIRRSRTNSNVGGARLPSTLYYGANNRDSVGSLRSLATATTTNQRTKFRSDPFDLERPELLGNAPAMPPILYNNNNNNNTTTILTDSTTTPNPSRNNNTYQPPPRRPSISTAAAGTTAAESFTSRYSSKYMSKYSSGVSAVSSLSAAASDGWSDDPGPDVGPAAARYTPSPEPLTERAGTGRNGIGAGTGKGKAGARVSGGSLGSLGSVGKAM